MSWNFSVSVSPTWKLPPGPVPPVTVAFSNPWSSRLICGLHGEMACTPAMGETPLVGPWQVAHCASSGCLAWVVSSQFLVVVLHVAMSLSPLQLASVVHPLVPVGKPSTVGGVMTAAVALGSTPPSGRRAPAKKTLSWQVPQAAREG